MFESWGSRWDHMGSVPQPNKSSTRVPLSPSPPQRRTAGHHLCLAGEARAPAGRHLVLERVQMKLKGQDLRRGAEEAAKG